MTTPKKKNPSVLMYTTEKTVHFQVAGRRARKRDFTGINAETHSSGSPEEQRRAEKLRRKEIELQIKENAKRNRFKVNEFRTAYSKRNNLFVANWFEVW